MGIKVIDIEELSDKQFQLISEMVREHAGIHLNDGKKELVKARLNKRLRELSINNYNEYIDFLHSHQDDEIIKMLDAISTNLTSFFRESDHFDYFAQSVLEPMINDSRNASKKVRIWSSGCSTGEEPYTLAIVVNEKIPKLMGWDIKILATDLSTRVLQKAKTGEYNGERLKSVPGMLRDKYFDCVEERHENMFVANNRLRSLIHFARLNLMSEWPMKGPFDAIFCRNVMIYFEKHTQEILVNRFYDLLRPGGVLFIGHSESLTGVKHNFKFAQPTVYIKQG